MTNDLTNTTVIVLNNRLFDIGPERNIKMSLIESVKAIFPSRNLVKDDAHTTRPQPPKPMNHINDEPSKSFKEILGDEIFISAEGRESFKVSKANKDSKDMNDKECNHDPNSEDSSLKMLPRRVMVAPAQFDMVCENCKKGFKFTKDNDTKKYVKYNGFNNENQ